MAILVTGGAGFIGSNLTEKLLTMGLRTICLDNFSDFYDPNIKRANISVFLGQPHFRLVEGDIRDKDVLEALFEGEHIETVIHLAALPGVRNSIRNPMIYEDVNVRGTINMLDICARHKVGKFVFGSSSSIYGLSKVPFKENEDNSRPVSPYAASKKAAELFCHTFSHLYNLPVCCLRFFTVYGPRQRPEMAIHRFTRHISEGIPIPVYGDGTTKRDYTYISDIVDGILSVLDAEFDFEIFNLGNSECVELRQLISLIEGSLGKKAITEQFADQPGDVPVTYASIAKSAELLGYRPRINIAEGIQKFVAWYKEGNSAREAYHG
jgi:UDP-glucuronate 4-epimerase